jgi:hypothetical protein
MITVDNVLMVITPSSVVPETARTVGGDLVFEIDGQITPSSIGCIVQTMGFEGIGFPNCLARIVSVHPNETEGRNNVVIRPPEPVSQPTVQYR